jgi:hypothetical protein
MPKPADGISIVSYADDVSIYASDPDINVPVTRLNSYLPQIADFFKKRKLDISTAKSTVTLFTPDTHQASVHPDVKINGTRLPLEKSPKILGVTGHNV